MRNDSMQDIFDYSYIFEDFELQFPVIASLTVKWRYFMEEVIIVDLDDDTSIFYDFANKSCRNIRHELDVNAISEEEWKSDFVFRLTKKMSGCGMSQRLLSEKTGISIMSINKYVRGVSIPSVYKMNKIARALNCSVSELTGIE